MMEVWVWHCLLSTLVNSSFFLICSTINHIRRLAKQPSVGDRPALDSPLLLLLSFPLINPLISHPQKKYYVFGSVWRLYLVNDIKSMATLLLLHHHHSLIFFFFFFFFCWHPCLIHTRASLVNVQSKMRRREEIDDDEDEEKEGMAMTNRQLMTDMTTQEVNRRILCWTVWR